MLLKRLKNENNMDTPTLSIKHIDISNFQYTILERDMYQCERCLSTVMDGAPIRPYLKIDGMNKDDPNNYFCSCPDCVDVLKWIYKNKNNGQNKIYKTRILGR